MAHGFAQRFNKTHESGGNNKTVKVIPGRHTLPPCKLIKALILERYRGRLGCDNLPHSQALIKPLDYA